MMLESRNPLLTYSIDSRYVSTDNKSNEKEISTM